jgi:hypothetical protein
MRAERDACYWFTHTVFLNLSLCEFTKERSARLFCTTIHKYTQPFPPISIDTSRHSEYLAHQIEPEA